MAGVLFFMRTIASFLWAHTLTNLIGLHPMAMYLLPKVTWLSYATDFLPLGTSQGLKGFLSPLYCAP